MSVLGIQIVWRCVAIKAKNGWIENEASCHPCRYLPVHKSLGIYGRSLGRSTKHLYISPTTRKSLSILGEHLVVGVSVEVIYKASCKYLQCFRSNWPLLLDILWRRWRIFCSTLGIIYLSRARPQRRRKS